MGAIHKAAREGDCEELACILARAPSAVNADDEHGWRPLCHAAYMGNEDAVELLIDHGADVGAHEGQALHFAAETPGNQAIVDRLILAGGLDALIRPHCDLTRQFFHAIYRGNAARAARLLELDPDMLDAPDGRGYPPLYHAAIRGDANLCRLFVQLGAEVDSPAPDRKTPLFGAVAHGHLEATRVLLGAPGDPGRRRINVLDILQWARATVPNDQELASLVALLSEHL